jgi:uncharacterized phage-associated protein
MKYPALLIANFFLQLAKEQGQPVTPMKLIKLIYFAHGWSLALRNQPLISENVEAWRYGPVIASVYHYFKKFGNEAITETAPDEKFAISKIKFNGDASTQRLLERIWEVHGQYTGVQLSNISHEEGSPWDIAWNKQNGKESNNHNNHIISNELMREFFANQAKQT